MNRSDWKLAALLFAYNTLVFGIAFGVGYIVSCLTGSLILAVVAFSLTLRFTPRLDAMW